MPTDDLLDLMGADLAAMRRDLLAALVACSAASSRSERVHHRERVEALAGAIRAKQAIFDQLTIAQHVAGAGPTVLSEKDRRR